MRWRMQYNQNQENPVRMRNKQTEQIFMKENINEIIKEQREATSTSLSNKTSVCCGIRFTAIPLPCCYYYAYTTIYSIYKYYILSTNRKNINIFYCSSYGITNYELSIIATIIAFHNFDGSFRIWKYYVEVEIK